MTETAHDVLHQAFASSYLTDDEKRALLDSLEAALENERAAVAQRCFVGFMHAAKSIANESGQWSSYGGTDGESDCPREPGSRHTRPEKFTEGARYLKGEA